jgi:RHS repeat-associated protein
MANNLDIETYEYNFAGERTKKITRLPNGSFTTTWFIGQDFQVQGSTVDNPPLIARTWRVGDVATITAGDVISGETTAQTVLANQYQPFAGDMQHGNAQGIWLKHQSRLGSEDLVTTPADGTEVSRYWYTPWGSLQRGNSLGYDTTSNKFTGKQFEEGSGLIYFKGRYYDPRSKRFITLDDRIVPGAGAQGYNRYAYVLNNPLRYVDPTGQAPIVSPHTNGAGEIDGIDVHWWPLLIAFGKGLFGSEQSWLSSGAPAIALRIASWVIEKGLPDLEPIWQTTSDIEFVQTINYRWWVTGSPELPWTLPGWSVEPVLAWTPVSNASLWLGSSVGPVGISTFLSRVGRETFLHSLYVTTHQENWCVGCGFYGKALQAQLEKDAASYEAYAAAGAGVTREQVLGLAGEGSGPLVSHPAEIRTLPPTPPSGSRSGGRTSSGSSGGRATGPAGAGGNPGEDRSNPGGPGGPGPGPGPGPGGGNCGAVCICINCGSDGD